MRKSYLIFCCAALLGGNCALAQGGLLTALKDKVTGGGGEAQQAAPAVVAEATPPPAEAAPAQVAAGRTIKGTKGKPSVRVVQGTPPPNAKPQPTPDKETIKAGAVKLAKQMDVERIPSDLFRRYAGKWKGDFWVYSPNGHLEESKATTMQFTANGDTMKMESFSFDRISQSWVTAETAVYTNQGSNVKVTITRPNGQNATQTGYYNDGQLFLLADVSDGIEHFRERVDGKRLLIDGFGVYNGKKGNDAHVFIGRFLKE